MREERSAARDLARLLACLLVALLLLQGLAATFSLVRGPAHRHAEVVLERMGEQHAHAHVLGLAHHHHEADSAVYTDADLNSADAGSLQLLSLLTAVGTSHGLLPLTGPQRALGTPDDEPRTRAVAPLLRPPRG